jgi:heme/copper-type cytochrome/quinol oxidase subunit 1
VFGIAGAISLIVYVSFLGTAEPFYEFMRRFGVYLYFLFSVIAQLLLAVETMRLYRQTESKSLRRVALAQLFLSISPFIVGILNLVLKAMLEDSDRAENAIEWIFALMMQCFFLLSYFSWKISKFHANFGVGRGPRSR